MKMKGSLEVCGVCFEQIKQGTEVIFMENGKFSHLLCPEKNADSSNLDLERIKADFENGVNATQLMDEMEQIFRIPALKCEEYNDKNPNVIHLYRQISDSRFE